MSRRPPKSPTPRAESKRQTREALIAAGIREFDDHGFDASLDAICARAKLTRGAFYVHFADRDAFIVAVMQHVLGTFVAALTGATELPGAAAAIRLFLAAARAGSPMIRGGAGLRFHHLLEACRRSPAIGNAYRGLVAAGHAKLAATLAGDAQVRKDLAPAALADLLVVAAFGVIVASELGLAIDLDRLESAMLGSIAG